MTAGETDVRLLRRAIALSEEARSAGNPPFGSVLADRTGIIAEETNTTVTDDDITAHPELKLARWAARNVPLADRADLTLYTSCAPCPMCENAIGRARIPHVVFALSDVILRELTSPDRPPASVPPRLRGPFLLEEASAVVRGHY